MTTLAERIDLLIRDRHAGNVNAAAKVMDIPQRTLLDLVRGKATNPQAKTLQKIAGHHRVSTDWLLTGQGQGPDAIDPITAAAKESVRWTELVLDLHLQEPTHSALLDLPGMIGSAAMNFRIDWQGRGARKRLPGHPTAEQTVGVAPRIVEAAALEYQAWILFFEDWLAADGKAKVVRELNRDVAWLQARFRWQAYFYFLERLAKEYDERVAAGRLPPGSPLAIPPVDIRNFPMLQEPQKSPRGKRGKSRKKSVD